MQIQGKKLPNRDTFYLHYVKKAVKNSNMCKWLDVVADTLCNSVLLDSKWHAIIKEYKLLYLFKLFNRGILGTL